MNTALDPIQARIDVLEHELQELRRSMPQHSIKATQLIRMEEIEEELNDLHSLRSTLSPGPE